MPELARLAAAGPLDGALLTDPAWLAGRVAEAGRSWSVADPRVVGTLWWYAASSALLAPPVVTLLVTGRAVDPDPRGLTVGLRPDGYLGGGRTGRLLDGDLGAAVRSGLGQIVGPLAAVSGAGERSLWAIAADSLGTWALRAGGPTAGADLARTVARAAGVLPLPRFVDIPGRDGPRRYLRRSSCCLLYLAPGGDKCTACPRQPPAERLRRLTAHARSS